MTKTKLNHFRKLLTDYAARARGTAGGLEDQTRLPTGGDAVGNLSNAPMHLGDAGTEMYSQEMNATLLEHEEHVMTEIAEALGRIDAGTYGVCENCGKKILQGRLEVIPYTRFCVKCADRLGSEAATNMNAGRPEPPRGSYAPRRERQPTGETSDTEVLDGDRLPVADLEAGEGKGGPPLLPG